MFFKLDTKIFKYSIIFLNYLASNQIFEILRIVSFFNYLKKIKKKMRINYFITIFSPSQNQVLQTFSYRSTKREESKNKLDPIKLNLKNMSKFQL